MAGGRSHSHSTPRPSRQVGGCIRGAEKAKNRPYRPITSDDPCKTLAQGEVRYFARIIDAAAAFVKAEDPLKEIVYDDGHEARFLTRDEQWVLESVCSFYGYDVEEVDG